MHERIHLRIVLLQVKEIVPKRDTEEDIISFTYMFDSFIGTKVRNCLDNSTQKVYNFVPISDINDYDTHARSRHDGCMPRLSLSTHL